MPKNAIPPDELAKELVADGILSATLSAPRATEASSKTRIHRISIDGETRFQIEEFRGPQAFHRNVSAKELEIELANSLGARFSHAEIRTDKGTVSVMANRRGELGAIRKKSERAADTELNKDTAQLGHDRAKKYILAEGVPVPFLVDLGVMTAEGAVVKSRYDKFRQINRFLEFIADVVPELERARNEHPDREIAIVDFGCGKSYLTFAVYHFLANMRGMPVRIVGLDLKKDVIEHCAGLAVRYGYERLSFAVGDIAEYAGADSADMVITLHACDTATDFALAQAVRWNSRVILSVPCCQHELNAQLGSRSVGSDLDSALRHGIIRERMAALFTDAMRADLLESEGYRVQILEFIDMSHTPKNLLIRAVRRDAGKTAGDEAGKSARARYEALRDFLGARPTLESELTAREPRATGD